MIKTGSIKVWLVNHYCPLSDVAEAVWIKQLKSQGSGEAGSVATSMKLVCFENLDVEAPSQKKLLAPRRNHARAS